MKNLAFLVISISTFAFSSASADDPKIRISPKVPDDIPGGAGNASLAEAAQFAWQEFIALNWPANTTRGMRDVPDRKEKFGDPSFSGPLVWHTYRHKSEIFPGTGDPKGYDTTKPDFGYNTLPPVYIYNPADVGDRNGRIPACPGQPPVRPKRTAFINLDETTQIGLDSMFAGNAPANVPNDINSFPQLIRFLAQGNETYYKYVVDPDAIVQGGDPLYDHPQPCPTDMNDAGYNHTYCVAKRNFTAVSGGDGDPVQLPGDVVDFPAGTILVKGAFRNLTAEELASGRFYTTTVRYYEEFDGTADRCYHEAEWGLVALHIIHKTPTAPSFVFATFEQTDNLLTFDGDPVEKADGRVKDKGGESSSTTPPLFYEDGDPTVDPNLPIVEVTGPYCAGDEAEIPAKVGSRLYYLEENGDTNPNLPSGGYICQNFRDRSIPSPVRRVNRSAQKAIKKYLKQNGLQDSPFLYYKLVNVQPEPFDLTQMKSHQKNGNRSEAVYYMANIVVETDYTLQRFSGQIAASGPPTDLPANFENFNGRETHQNVLTFDGDTLTETANMGGCMGCHGVAQSGGNDFAFTLGGGRVTVPEAPEVDPPGTSNPRPPFP